MARNRLGTATGLVMLLAAGGCSSGPPLKIDPAMQAQSYALGAGDRLRVTVFNEPTLTGEYGVTGDGYIAFPLIGNVAVAGKSIDQAQELLRTALGNGYVKDPRVAVEVLSYRPYYMTGEIGHSGAFPYTAGLTVSQAIAAAGGFSYRANTRHAYIKRDKDPVEHSIDLKNTNILVQPGDVIRVGERYF